MCPAGGTRQLNFLVATHQSLEGKRQLCSILCHVHVETQILYCFKTGYGDSNFHPKLFVPVESCRLLPPTVSLRDVPGRASGGAPLEQSLNFWLHLWRQSSDFFLPALSPAPSFTRRLTWLSSAHVDSELAACPAHKSKRGIAGWDPAQA